MSVWQIQKYKLCIVIPITWSGFTYNIMNSGFLFFFFNRLLLNIPSIIAVANSCSSASNFKDHSIFRTIFFYWIVLVIPKIFANSWPLASNFKSFSPSLELFSLTVDQQNTISGSLFLSLQLYNFHTIEIHSRTLWHMVFCNQNCSDLLW